MTSRVHFAGAFALALVLSFAAAGQETPTAPAPAPTPAAATPPPQETPAPAPSPTPGPIEPTGLVPLNVLGSSGQVTSGTAFNPAISVIPDLVYYRDSVQGGAFGILDRTDGFRATNLNASHDAGALNEGFNLRETELAFSASVDPYFDVAARFSASESSFAAEEVYARTRMLPAGLAVKIGKFLSGFGYANSHHPHQWDFVDASLAQTLLLGPEGLNEKGVQVTWLPKLPFYVQVGTELLQGENEKIASYLGPVDLASGGALGRKAGPRLFTGFVKVAPNLGYDAALQLGASYARSTKHQELYDVNGDGIATTALEGTVDLWGVEAVFKLDPGHPFGAGALVVQTEYLYREKSLDAAPGAGSSRSRQDGLYAQAVYGIGPRWQAAARYDVVGLTSSIRDGGLERTFGTSSRWSAALTFNPSEFSRMRAQYERGDILVAGVKKPFDQLSLQLQLSVGAHGAHAF